MFSFIDFVLFFPHSMLYRCCIPLYYCGIAICFVKINSYSSRFQHGISYFSNKLRSEVFVFPIRHKIVNRDAVFEATKTNRKRTTEVMISLVIID